MAKLSEIEGIGPVFEAKLNAVGVKTIEGLLKAGATKKGRVELADKSGVGEKNILEWVNAADLFRIRGVGSEYADLLEEAGVDTVVELATRKPENLFKKIVEVNADKKLVRKLPTEAQVADWVKQAGKLPRVIEY
jgi:predicted flap endonuclease-1-like 5' DNA nuclease